MEREKTDVATKEFTLHDLKRILLAGAGAEEGVDLDGDILDVPFKALGYESLALLETGSLIEREYDISLDDDALTDADTPRALIAVVNTHLTVPA
ncbi:phosphopantetheine-binding protein [Streptomyces tubercidicus]|uniref:Actinorhodin polyketide synthase acyl carrier protein n=1 Tax=Streptomyces tubercidicus TaxID=47759 RepID=A0A640UXS7_9ACTN|nr:phosphopantetheine-binding protein [Streptomyces tubercidicus]WAU14475.1 phosphopantetheine-binding protein [Streptomyces tubercidicus]GFE40214.1 actinorhodin polyketide synthase acyl carrier protein [Streptomyces tubercidicus]